MRDQVLRQRWVGTLLATMAWSAGCASAPPLPPQMAGPPPVVVTVDEKMAWAIRLEHQRTLRDASITPAPVAVVDPVAPPPVTPVVPTSSWAPADRPDLLILARDPEAAVRRRAAVAIGRVGQSEGVSSLSDLLRDPEPEVRAAAAFALGLVADRAAIRPLEMALEDPTPLVRGKAAEGLGLIGDAAAAPAIARAFAGCGPLLAPIAPDDEEWPKSPEIEACRLALFALARLKQFEALSLVAVGTDGDPVSQWWPVAYALQRVGDPKAAPFLLPLASVGIYPSSFALRGLATAKHPGLLPIGADLARRSDVDLKVRVAAIRALGQLGDKAAAKPLADVLAQSELPVNLVIEALGALGSLAAPSAFETVLDFLSSPAPAVRAAALSAAGRTDPDAFLLVLAGLGRDPDWSVRAALATVLGTLPADRVTVAIEELVADDDARVHGPALEALAAVRAPTAAARAMAALAASDFVERETAASLIAELKPEGAASALEDAYKNAQSDSTYSARIAILEALAKVAGERSVPTLRHALADREWPVRVRAAELLKTLGDADASPDRPAPLRQPLELFADAPILHPAYSPRAFIESRHGTIEVQLNVIESPITTLTFIEQARSGLFNGMRAHRVIPGFVFQAGDPRGDGNGGPGYTTRDELNPIPYLRGSMGIALAGKDTGGSQWFITLSPQPHLDGKYTAFGRVVNGWDVLDLLSPWDVIDRVRVWDGVELR